MIVLDTHAWLWWVSEPGKLSRLARQRIAAARMIGIPAICCFEVATAVVLGLPALVREGLTWSDMRLRALSAAPVRLSPRKPNGGQATETT